MPNLQADNVTAPPEEAHVAGDGAESRLEQTARRIAANHIVTGSSSGRLHLLERLPQQEALLQEAYQHFVQASDEELAFSYAAEWILDNFYLIRQELRQVRKDLPPTYYRELPKLDVESPLQDYPRIYAVAKEIMLYEECRLDPERLRRFMRAYQSVQSLTMGELWALPIMLRLALLESLAQAVGRTTSLFTDTESLPPAFHYNYDLDDNDIVANCIPSLRQIDSQNWNRFFESISQVEETLRRDPAGIYPLMDFDTRDRYRKVVETLALASGHAEVDVARSAIELARAFLATDGMAPADETDEVHLFAPRVGHVGYYLLDGGRSHLETHLNYRPAGLERLRRVLLARPTPLYLGSITLLTLAILLGFVSYALATGGAAVQVVVAVLLGFIPAVSVAVNLVNWLVTHFLTPRVLPKLDLKKGVLPSCRTMVVVPALFSSSAEVKSLLTQLEMHYLRNPDRYITFALLTDFTDAPEPELPEDDELIAEARSGIERLNGRYSGRPFYLFHRRRLWNSQEGVWMGWERKRGKLHEFNQLLRGRTDTSYTVQIGDLPLLPQIRYVITLDADTVLPRDSARRLIGALAHPLNQARFDSRGRVSAGYTILQPRTEIQSTSANQSLFTRVFAGDTGIDLYSLAVSDVYQDLFGEGSYVGKGIYDVGAFEQSLDGRVPENSLLSHDLFEGIHGRAGLVTDVVLYEDYPPHYLVQVRRSHRWIRGDWQLLPWLLPWAPHPDGWKPNSLALIDQWKIADNLRRSLVAPALLLLFLAGWTWLPGSALVWTLLGLLIPIVSLLTSLISGLVQGLTGATLRAVVRPLRDDAIRWLLLLAFLPYEAILVVDAVGTTLVRLLTRRRLLQWTTAANTARLFGEEVSAGITRRQMLSSFFIAAILALLIYFINPGALLLAAPLLALWMLAPEIAHLVSRPYSQRTDDLSEEQRRQLRTLARRTWLFFEQYVGPEDNWLPPDHFQESPNGVVAHRTSPTNVGLYLLSVVAAHDLGYISTMNLILRLRSSFDTLAGLERYHGHFLNWIDTSSLAPLSPRYISSVDSGNLAGCLLALRQGCLQMRHQPAWRWQRWQGLLDTMGLLGEVVTGIDKGAARQVTSLQAYLEQVRQQVLSVRDTPAEWPDLLLQLAVEGRQEMDRHLMDLIESNPEGLDAEIVRSLRLYSERVRRHLQGMRREMDLLLPWILALKMPPALFTQPGAEPALQTAWQALQAALPIAPTLDDIPNVCTEAQAHLEHLQRLIDFGLQNADFGMDSAIRNPQSAIEDSAIRNPQSAILKARDWCTRLTASLGSTRVTVNSLLVGLERVADEALACFEEMDFSFLFDEQRQVFHIGYNLDSGQLDRNYYDLLASEARIASLAAIAKNDVPQSHWLHLARPIAGLDPGETLLSWSGTMFEYLMPPLLMRSYAGTLLHQSCQVAVLHQIDYGRQQGVPWGISESGFYTFDAHMNYQYRAFGVPGLGFKRGLGEDLVVTPYASLLALPFQPRAVVDNIDHLTRLGMLGRFGLYEAVDFTRSRLAVGQEKAIVQSYMSHHQGMIMLSLVNYLQQDRMVYRFHAEPCIQSVELLLQEQIPQQAPVALAYQQEARAVRPTQAAIVATPWKVPVETPMPYVHFLGNGRYSLLISNSGSGYSRWQDLALTRWRADMSLDDWGCWLYVQDLDSGATYSPTSQPLGHHDGHEVQFYPHKVEFRRLEGALFLQMEVAVSLDDDVEVRRVTLTNNGDNPRRLRLTSYAEVALSAVGDDLRHPAFAKLFVESESLAQNALLFRRRPRSAKQEPVFLLHMLVLEQGQEPATTLESDRARFLGRGNTARMPAALESDSWLTGATGATLDPVMALGQVVELPPRTTAQLALVTLVTDTRQQALALAERYDVWAAVEHVFAQTRTHSERELRQLNMTVPDLEQAQQLLSLLFYPRPGWRAELHTLAANRKGQPGLWAFGISGDYPILLVRLHNNSHITLLQELLRAHVYWRRRHLRVDLVILNEEETNYGEALQGYIHRLIHHLDSDNWMNRAGGVFIMRVDQLNKEDLVLLQTAARVVLDGGGGSLAEQLQGLGQLPVTLPAFASAAGQEAVAAAPPLLRPDDLLFDNGIGGFSPDGREYIIYLSPTGETEVATPAPWINVIANEEFGFLVSETGAGYSWAVNSGENRLTTWRNDPVTDRPAEVLYLRDEETAEIWTPTPQPAPADSPYLVRHGAGYTEFEHHSHGLKQRLRLFAVPDAPVKVAQLRLENTADGEGSRTRRLTATYYAEWVLGTSREFTQQHIVPEYDRERNALLARNWYNVEFSQRVAFLATSREPHGLTADRVEFLGHLGSLARPAALQRIGLEGRVEPGLDPCAVMQLHIDLPPGASEEIYFLLGQGAGIDETQALIECYLDADRVAAAWQLVHETWDDILDQVMVETPDAAMNVLLNRWLLYQSLACRIWGRSALYQSSGAYGYRDQLQDVMSVIHTRPDVARRHIVRAAHYQFEEGDVLHWWHPPYGRGVRTRISDDLLWLPYVTAFYIEATGDVSILEEEMPFLRGKPLEPDEEERYGYYETGERPHSLYEHCRRVLHRSDTRGRYGLPLIGGGDWNDGMNRVGIKGKGESVWMGWFYHATLSAFAAVCERIEETEQAEAYRRRAEELRQALEANAWDGEWYRRAYYDDGTPLGSAQNTECQIDSIAQSWGVISDAADPERVQQAMASVLERLVQWDDQLILLFTPPFDKTAQDPGYIKGYLPGIRENGGQYTHAALWTIWAFAELGQGELAEKLFRLINPIYRADTPEKAEHYKVEPYVISADVYGVPPHTGRGGWTWYTGSSGWMYQLGVTAILGLRREEQRLYLDPCIPKSWPGYRLTYRCGAATYEIHVENPDGVNRGVKQVTLDGQALPDGWIPLVDDGRQRQVRVRLG